MDEVKDEVRDLYYQALDKVKQRLLEESILLKLKEGIIAFYWRMYLEIERKKTIAGLKAKEAGRRVKRIYEEV